MITQIILLIIKIWNNIIIIIIRAIIIIKSIIILRQYIKQWILIRD